MSHNTWLHKIARLMVRPLVDSPVRPNHLTTVRLLSGLAASGLFALGNAGWVQLGAAVFLVSTVLDRADGELARLSGKTSQWGHAYDLWADGICNAVVFAGIGIGLRDSALGLWSIPLGLLAGLGVSAVFALVLRLEALDGARAGELGSFAGFDPDDAMLIVPLVMALGGAEPLLIAAAVGAPLFALFFFWHFRRRLAKRGP